MESSPVLFELFGLEVTSEITTMWALMIFLCILALLATRNPKRIPSGVQNFVEFIVESLLNFFSTLMGEDKARRYLPFLCSLFLFILASNYSGLLPGAGHITGFKAPTSSISVTVGLAIVVFFATHILGIKEKGFGYFKHFIEPIPLMLPLTIVEEFVKPLSLSLRLFGNIFGEELVMAVLFSLVPLFIPLPMMVLGTLFGFIQAFVFTLLAAIYIGTATASE